MTIRRRRPGSAPRHGPCRRRHLHRRHRPRAPAPLRRGLARSGYVNLVFGLGHVGQDRDVGIADLYEAAVDGERVPRSVLFDDVDRPHLEDPDERDVTGLKAMSPPSTVRATTIEASPVYDTDSGETTWTLSMVPLFSECSDQPIRTRPGARRPCARLPRRHRPCRRPARAGGRDRHRATTRRSRWSPRRA